MGDFLMTRHHFNVIKKGRHHDLTDVQKSYHTPIDTKRGRSKSTSKDSALKADPNTYTKKIERMKMNL